MQASWSDTDLAACRAQLRDGSRSFLAASRLLPRRVSAPATILYAFCRSADDAIDIQGGRVEALRLRLARIYAGTPLDAPADRALAALVVRYAMPRALPEALLEGLAWDAEGRRYEHMAALHAYAARVAGSVGAMMAVLIGARTPTLVARACDLGVAMQLSNIARDVGEDARRGRLYLPLRAMQDQSIDPDAWLARPVFTPALGVVVRDVLAEADRLYARADDGIAGLPRACRPGIRAARRLYAAIGRSVRLDEAMLDRRAVVPPLRKAMLVAGGLYAPTARRSRAPLPPLPAVSFLIDAVARMPIVPMSAVPSTALDRRAAWLIDLFIRLDARGGGFGAEA